MNISESDIIFRTSLQVDKIYVKEQSGFYQKLRRAIAWPLMLLFVVLPLVEYQGRQAVWFDVASQQFHIFNLTLFPQDFMAIVFLFIIAAFALFWLSAKYGRVWCGFTCPQTIWTLMFIWVENRIEGNRQQRIKMDSTKWTLSAFAKKLIKHLLWGLISLFTAIVFMSYFITVDKLVTGITTLSLTPLISGWICFFTLCTYVNAGLIREKMCQHMCPYARFQSVMVTPESKVVAYDIARGESRGARKIKANKPNNLGDCVDCGLCVQVCPVGIDIRNGFQADCINCGLCIDACDSVMSRFDYPKRLIQFVGQKPLSSSFRAWGYLIFMVLFVLSALLWAQQRTELEMTIIKDRYLLYRESESGGIENVYQLRLINKTNQFKMLGLELTDSNLTILNNQTWVLKPLENRIINLVLTAEEAKPYQRLSSFVIKVIDKSNEQEMLSREGTFQMP